MVKLGFIVEGDTEKIILERTDFFSYLSSKEIAFVPEVLNAAGNGNLLPHNVEKHTRILEAKGATHIFTLTDIDEDNCITLTKNRISPQNNQTVIVSIKAIESWFLADTESMKLFLNDDQFSQQDPENIIEPYEHIRTLRFTKTGRGISGKVILAKSLTNTYKFSIINAAKHPACSSARYFLDKIDKVAG